MHLQGFQFDLSSGKLFHEQLVTTLPHHLHSLPQDLSSLDWLSAVTSRETGPPPTSLLAVGAREKVELEARLKRQSPCLGS